MDDGREMGRGVSRRKTASNLTFCVKKENDGKYRKVYAALQKKEDELTEEERQLVLNNADHVKKARESLKKREEVKARSEEFEDPDDILISKCSELAAALRNSRHLVVYTGAGISTAAKIPDYRGSNGIWTLLQKGKEIGKHDLSQAEPTLTHMALFELYSKGILKYIVSQNCDGLHLRSGLPRTAISEVHGNMHLEVCQLCRPSTQYWRMFDVTENTGRFTHRTMRRCHICHAALIDTIVHFGERGNLPWPLNWPAASKAADNADTILCIGSSLKVLKKYPWLWGMDKPARKRPKLYIINLQWTPKDDHAVLKINGRCDRVMQEVMKCLNLKIPEYNRFRDPIFCHATHLHPDEAHTTSQPELDSPFKSEKDLNDRTTASKQSLKRISSSNESELPKKLRKFDHELAPVIKEEPMEEVDKKYALTLSKNDMGQMRKELKQEPVDHIITNMQTTWPGCESFSFFMSAEEVVGQINSSGNSKDHDFVSMSLAIEKKDDEMKSSVLLSGQNFAANTTLELTCSKVNIENLSPDIDGKENVAICFSKENSETIKSSKKSENERTLDASNGSERSSKSLGNQVAKSEFMVDTLKGQKSNMKNSSDVSEDEVVVLKMLQLEHNYSKASDEVNDNCSGSKEAKQDLKKELKEIKKVPNCKQDRNLRRISRDAVNYVEDEEEDDEEEEEEDEDEDEDDQKRGTTRQSVRSSLRVQDKNTKQPDKKNVKQQAKIENKKNVEVEKKRAKSSTASAKPSKPPTPLKNKKLTKADFEIRIELKSKSCIFCLDYYKSETCLFYPSLDFRPRRFEGCICECCDYSSDSEDIEEDGSSGETNEAKGDSTDNAEESSSKASIVNPGWYGKGYRKRFRKKK
ncbi:hypothetical protein ONE63_008661 [Megalurothrips usitatus]|uniref:protein acetyllysine N-acetyltransferase n=1 Tax=Megalurothrips usitatus TaxID=439358 RepID=A0AAV7XMX7_9NEOP|nr:hypothetical protein ONE63_008661 [Megalurothrips usitatus]